MTLASSAAPVLAQGFQLGTWSGSLESVNDFSKQETKTGSERATFETRRMDDRLTIRNSGAYIYDPGLVTLSLGGTFGLSREQFETGESSGDRTGTVHGYDALAEILSEQPFSLNLFASRQESFLSRELAGSGDIRTENRGARFSAKRLYIPSTLTVRQEIQEEESRTADIVARRKDRRNIFTYEGQRGWVDAEMDARYELIDDTDEVFPDLSHRSQEGSLNYSLDFGPELNWRWDSRLRYFSQRGVRDLTTSTVDELLRIDHTERFRTEYRYALGHMDTQAGSTTIHTAGASAYHRLYESLTTTGGLDGTWETPPGGRKATSRAHLDFAYAKRLPAGGRLNVGLGGAGQYQDERFEDLETAVLQESHTAATPVALPITLRDPSVVASSIVVTKTAVGPLPAGCIAPPIPPTPLVLGRDFTLRSVGGDLTDIVPIPCAGATPGINPGDTIAVDYQFTVPPSRTFTTATRRFDISIDYKWIRPYFIYERTDQSLLSGEGASFLDNPESKTLGVELRWDGARVRASLLGEGRRYDSQRLKYDSVRSTQIVTVAVLSDVTLSFNADQARFEYSDPARETRTVTGRLTLTYAPDARLSADATVGMRWLRDTLVPEEQALDATLRVRWIVRSLEVSPTVEFHDLQRGDTETKMFRVLLNVIRRF